MTPTPGASIGQRAEAVNAVPPIPKSALEEWSGIRSVLEGELGGDAWARWIKPIALTGRGERVVHLGVPTEFVRRWVQANYLPRIAELWAEFHGMEQVELEVCRPPAAEQSPAPATPRPVPATSDEIGADLPRLRRLLETALKNHDVLYAEEESFVRTLIDWTEKYGAGTRVSRAQRDWLNTIRKRLKRLGRIARAPAAAGTGGEDQGDEAVA